MDTKITKKRLNVHFEYDWIKYIAIVAAAIIFWWVIYSVAGKIPAQDKISFVLVDAGGGIVGPSTDTTAKKFENNRAEIFGEGTAIKKFEFSHLSSTTDNVQMPFFSLFRTRVIDSDFMVAPMEWMTDNPQYLEYLLDFGTIQEKATVDGVEYPGYWKNKEDGTEKDFLKKLATEDATHKNALYQYRFDKKEQEEQRRRLEAKLRKENPNMNDAEIATEVDKNFEMMKADVERNKSNGKVFGIILNNIKGLETSFLFPYLTEKKDGATVETEKVYVLSLIGYSEDKKKAGGNRGHFNGTKEDKNRTEVFDLVEHLFSPSKEDGTKINALKYVFSS